MKEEMMKLFEELIDNKPITNTIDIERILIFLQLKKCRKSH